MLAVGNIIAVRCRLLAGARRVGAHGGGEGRGHTVATARLQLVLKKTYSKLVNLLGFRKSNIPCETKKVGKTPHAS